MKYIFPENIHVCKIYINMADWVKFVNLINKYLLNLNVNNVIHVPVIVKYHK